MGHHFVHIEINGRDIDRSRRFYETAFGWKIDYTQTSDPEVPYGLVNTGERPGGGIGQAGPDQPLGVLVYIGSDNLAETLSKIEAAGGRTITPPTEVPSQGWFALFADPDGNTLGLWKDTSQG
jgi:predicted enzyme related to lactoylglutathione lyase